MATRRFPVAGELDMAAAPAVKTKLGTLIAATTDDITLDCENLTFIDSSGIRVFVKTHQALAAQGRALRIENLSDRCRRPFAMLGLIDVLGIDELDPA